MKHPFTKLLETALAKSSSEDNLLTREVEKILEKGYSEKELYSVLLHMKKGRLDDGEVALIEETLKEVCEAAEDDNIEEE